MTEPSSKSAASNNVNNTNNTNNTNTATTRKTFENPLALSGAYQPDLHSRIQVDMPREERDFFVSIRPTKNTMQTLINILLVKLQTQLKHHGITTVIQQREFCEYITECRIEDGRDGRTEASIASAVASAAANARPVIIHATAGNVHIGGTAARPVPEASSSNDGRRKTKAPRQSKKLKE